jgi:replicative DNA helicase Mcm
LCGDPGAAKSQLLRYISNLLPRGVFASGKATTGAGLTAAAVRDEFGEGRWTLEAGAMVLADKGGVCIDELDKMSPQDSSSMHEAMEAQSIAVNKAGINATFQSRCSVLAAANPKNGRFDQHDYLADQITLSPALLSRFDAIFPIVDKIDRKRDSDIAGHILKVHYAGEISHYRETSDGIEHTKEEEDEAKKGIEPVYAIETLRKYIAFARRNICPVMTKDTMDTIQDYYIDIRASAKPAEEGGGSVPMTPRQIEAIIRMSEASARMRLSDKVLPIDAERAKSVMDYYLRKVATEGGVIDIDNIMTGMSHNRLQHRNNIIDAIEELDDGKGVSQDDVYKKVKAEGYDEEKVGRELQRMMRDGILWIPEGDRYKVMRREPR